MQTFFTPDRMLEQHFDSVVQKFDIMRTSFKDQTVLAGMLEEPKHKRPAPVEKEKPIKKKKTVKKKKAAKKTTVKKKKATNGRRKTAKKKVVKGPVKKTKPIPRPKKRKKKTPRYYG